MDFGVPWDSRSHPVPHSQVTTSDQFEPLSGDELSVATNALASRGFEPSEFVLEEQRAQVHLAGGSDRSFKLVSVKRPAVGLQRVYNCGRGGSWPFAFERDLRCGTFGEAAPRSRAQPAQALGQSRK
jgi:hypothetical protein